MARGKRPEAPREGPAQPHFEALRELIAVIEADGADATDVAERVLEALQASAQVAEGVERREQAELLRRFRCHEAQGFWFDPALPADEFEGRIGHDVTPRQTAGNDGAGP